MRKTPTKIMMITRFEKKLVIGVLHPFSQINCGKKSDKRTTKEMQLPRQYRDMSAETRIPPSFPNVLVAMSRYTNEFDISAHLAITTAEVMLIAHMNTIKTIEGVNPACEKMYGKLKIPAPTKFANNTKIVERNVAVPLEVTFALSSLFIFISRMVIHLSYSLLSVNQYE